MNKRVEDCAIIDAVSGYCAMSNITASELGPMTFHQVIQRLAEFCQKNPQWAYASCEVRRYYPICHQECHYERIRAFMQQGCKWHSGQGPEEQRREDNVVEFPLNSTRH